MYLDNRCRQVGAKQSTGFSLTELMVTIAIGSFIALAGTTFYVTTVVLGKIFLIPQSALNSCMRPLRPYQMIYVAPVFEVCLRR